jgi:hypothetical protein
MGPADFAGQDAVSALESVVDAEGGVHHVRATGTIRFMSRSRRYNALTPTLTFGENTAGGEIPYTDLQLDYDPTRVANVIQVTQSSTGQVFTARDATSIANYGPRGMQRSVNTTNPLECQDAADYLLSRFKDPKVRVSSLKIDVGANPSAWAQVAGIELGTRVRVMRRPIGAPAVQLDCFVEQIQWDFDDLNGAILTLQCSPADVTPYGLFAAYRTTLNGSIASGVSSFVVNAGTADTTQALAAQLGQGQRLVLGLGTANAETVTVDHVGSSSPLPGWTAVTVYVQSATTKSHTSGDVISEPLPSGITAPSTYDVAGTFDSINFAY